jgi:hypothetical protein
MQRKKQRGGLGPSGNPPDKNYSGLRAKTLEFFQPLCYFMKQEDIRA